MYNVIKTDNVVMSDEIYVLDYNPISSNFPELSDNQGGKAPVLSRSEVDEELARQRIAEMEKDFVARQHAIIAQANERASEIMQSVNVKMAQEREQLIQTAKMEAAKQIEEAKVQGYRDSYEQARADLEGCILGLSEASLEINRAYRGFTDSIKEQVVEMALEVAEKIMRKKIDADPKEMYELACSVVDENAGSEWVTLELSSSMKELAQLVETKMRASCASLRVTANSPVEYACIVDTPLGVTDASIQTQLDNLKKNFGIK